MISHLRFFEDKPESLKDAPIEGIRKFLRNLRREVNRYTDDGVGTASFDAEASNLSVIRATTIVDSLVQQRPGRAERLLKETNQHLRPWLADQVEDGDSDLSEVQRLVELDPAAPTPVVVEASTPGTPRLVASIEEQDLVDEARYQARQQVRFASPETAPADTEDIEIPDRDSLPQQASEERSPSPTSSEERAANARITGRREEWLLLDRATQAHIRNEFRKDVHDDSNDPNALLSWLDSIRPHNKARILRLEPSSPE